jgi:rubrerythrin
VTYDLKAELKKRAEFLERKYGRQHQDPALAPSLASGAGKGEATAVALTKVPSALEANSRDSGLGGASVPSSNTGASLKLVDDTLPEPRERKRKYTCPSCKAVYTRLPKRWPCPRCNVKVELQV